MSGRAHERPELPRHPLVSVVIPVRNEERFIADTLHQLQRQELAGIRLELLVCDGMSDDRTREIVRRMATEDSRIRLIDNPGIRSSSGRNVGFRTSAGQIVLVIDGHVEIPDDRLIQHVVAVFRESGADCLGRPQPLIPERDRPWSEAIALARSSRLGHNPGSMIYSDYAGFAPAASMGAAYRSYVFDEIGWVDEEFDACEDLEFNTRLDKAGLRCFTSPKLTVRYYARTSPGQLFRQLRRYGFGRFKYLTRHPDRLSAGQLIPPALVLGLVSLLPMWFVFRPLAWIGSAVAVLYVLALLAAAMQLALSTKARLFLRFIVVIPVIHLAVGSGFLSAMLSGGKLRAPAARVQEVGE